MMRHLFYDKAEDFIIKHPAYFCLNQPIQAYSCVFLAPEHNRRFDGATLHS